MGTVTIRTRRQDRCTTGGADSTKLNTKLNTFKLIDKAADMVSIVVEHISDCLGDFIVSIFSNIYNLQRSLRSTAIFTFCTTIAHA